MTLTQESLLDAIKRGVYDFSQAVIVGPIIINPKQTDFDWSPVPTLIFDDCVITAPFTITDWHLNRSISMERVQSAETIAFKQLSLHQLNLSGAVIQKRLTIQRCTVNGLMLALAQISGGLTMSRTTGRRLDLTGCSSQKTLGNKTNFEVFISDDAKLGTVIPTTLDTILNKQVA